MADIAKFGIEVDPKAAVVGSQKAEKAIRDVGTEAERTEKKIVRGNKRSGQSTKNMARVSRGAFKDLSNGIIDLLDGFGLLNNGFGSLIRRGQNLTQAGARLGGQLSQTSGSAAEVAASTASAAGGITTAGSAAKSAGIKLGALAAILGVVLLAVLAVVAAFKAMSFVLRSIKQGVGLAAEFQKTQVAVETLVGSTRKANIVLQELADLSNTTPLSPKEVQDAGRTLLAFGSSTDTVVEEIKRIGDVAQGVQAPLGEIATLYGKARVQGTLFAEDINQLTNRGIPVIQLFAQQLGVSESQVKKLGSEGKITFDNLEAAFITMTGEGGKFQGMMDRLSQTFSGKVSTLSGLWNNLLKVMGEPIRDALAPVLDDLIGFVQLATPAARAFGEMIGNAIRILYQAVSDGKLESLLGNTFMAGLEILLQGLFDVFKAAVNFFAQLWSTVVEFVGVGLGNALGLAFGNATEFFKKAMHSILVFVAGAFNKIVDASNAITGGNAGGIVVGASGGGGGPSAGFDVDTRTFADMFEGNRQDFVGDTIGNPVPTTFRDAAAKSASDLLLQSFIDNPGLSDIDRDPLPTKTFDEGALGGGKGGGGAEGAAKKAKETQEQLSEQTKQLLEDFGNIQAGIDNIVAGSLSSFSNGFADAFTAIATGSATASEAFTQMASQIIGDITRMIIQMTVQLAVQKALGGAGAGLTGFIGGLPTAHSGGLGGNSGLPRSGTGGLSTFHSGGLSSSEAAVKVDRNETILTRKRSEELEMQLSQKGDSGGGSGGQPVQILNVTDQSQVSDALAANPDMIVNAISKRMPAVRNMILNNRKR